MDDVKWLKEMLRRELDLMAPSLARIGKNSVIIKDEIDRPIAHARLSDRWNGHEINSFAVSYTHLTLPTRLMV